MDHMCVIINKEKHHLESLHFRKLTGNDRWRLQNKSWHEQGSPSATRWHDQHQLPPPTMLVLYICLKVQ